MASQGQFSIAEIQSRLEKKEETYEGQHWEPVTEPVQIPFPFEVGVQALVHPEDIRTSSEVLT